MKITDLFRAFRKPAAAPNPDTVTLVVDVVALQRELHLAQCAYLAGARRISAFAIAQPDMYRLHFTKAGDAIRRNTANAAA